MRPNCSVAVVARAAVDKEAMPCVRRRKTSPEAAAEISLAKKGGTSDTSGNHSERSSFKKPIGTTLLPQLLQGKNGTGEGSKSSGHIAGRRGLYRKRRKVLVKKKKGKEIYQPSNFNDR